MSWRVVVRPEAEQDISEAAAWYEIRQPGLGGEFRQAVLDVLETLVDNPLLNCRQHPRRNIRWRLPQRFPYRVIYEVIQEERTAVVAAVLHAARQNQHWQRRL